MSSIPSNAAESRHAETIAWARNALGDENAPAQLIVETSFSLVFKIGNAYLKQTAPDLFIEAAVIRLCRDIGITCVPELIAVNKAKHCFLMKDCGDMSLRTLFDGNVRAELLAKGVRQYRALQKATLPHIDAFLKAGVPDWRLARLPALYDALVQDEKFLQEQQIGAGDAAALRGLSPRVKDTCRALEDYGVPECLNHSDFHDNNILVRVADETVSVIDLGESAIDHPFLTLSVFMLRMGWRYGATPGTDAHEALYPACFEGWLASPDRLHAALALAARLLPLYNVLAHKRLFDATGPVIFETAPRMNERIRNALLEMPAKMA